MQTNENRRESLPAPWLALGAGVACAALWVLGYMGGLGVGMTASSLLILGVGMYLCRRQICWRADSILLLTLAVLLSLAYGIFGSLAMQIFNLPVLCLLLSQSLLALAGHCHLTRRKKHNKTAARATCGPCRCFVVISGLSASACRGCPAGCGRMPQSSATAARPCPAMPRRWPDRRGARSCPQRR